MPHFVVEYSNNLDDAGFEPDALLKALCETAVATELFPESGLRARAYRADHQRVAHGDPNHGFVHVGMNIGKGRQLDDRQRAGEALFECLKTMLAPVMETRTVLLSFEMREIDDVKFNFKNL